MTDSKSEGLAVRMPIREPRYPDVKGRQWPPPTFLSSAQVPGCDLHVDLGWVYETPEPNPHAPEQVLDHDQVLVHIGMDPDRPQDLGATLEFWLGGQRIAFNTTTSIFIPKGTPHGPLTWLEFRRPHLQLAIVFGNGAPLSGAAPAPGAGAAAPAAAAAAKTRPFDYEQYVIRSPIREAGPADVQGRQKPTMTYLSRLQIPGVNHYLEFGWIYVVPTPAVPRMRHDAYDEVVWHIGCDPDHPEDLGGTLQFGLGDETLEFETTNCVFIPRGLDHGPLDWTEVKRPLIEMALVVGAGAASEAWGTGS